MKRMNRYAENNGMVFSESENLPRGQMKVAITGATGFVGSRLVERLHAEVINYWS